MPDGQTLIPCDFALMTAPRGNFSRACAVYCGGCRFNSTLSGRPARVGPRLFSSDRLSRSASAGGCPSLSDAPMNALPPVRRSGGTMGEGRRPETVAVADEEPHPEITLRQISAWSLAILAAVAVGFVLYAAREVMLPVVAAFVVGVMLGPAARQTRSAARSAPARGAAACGQRDADLRFRDPVDLPARVRTREWLAGHGRVAEGKAARIRWSGRGVAASHNDDRRARPAPMGLRFLCPGFPGFPRRSRSCCRRLRAFCSFSSCCFWSSRNGQTCGAASS